ncbi:MAG: hypothetical protein MUE55_06010 [Thermoplasmata archaeon]|nr:hypothetical protein [Thermoplasmata archaeon]
MPDPDKTVNQVAVVVACWLGICLFITFNFGPWAVFSEDMDNIIRIGFALFSLCFLPWAFYAIESGGYDAAIFSDGGIRIRQVRTGAESLLSWDDVSLFTYSTSDGAFSSYRFRIGKQLMQVGDRGDENKAMIDMIVRHVPRSKWRGAELTRYLKEHFGIEVDPPAGTSSDQRRPNP